jgi:prevent-host-death family protein
MPRVNDLLPVTDLRQDAAKVLKRIRASHEPVVVTQRGRAAAVILSVEAYETGEHERELLRLVARGEADIRARAGVRMKEVLAQADAILKKV